MELLPEDMIKYRQSKGLSQREVAAHLGIAQRSYYAYEKGIIKPKSSKLKKLLELYGISEDLKSLAPISYVPIRDGVPVYDLEFSVGLISMLRIAQEQGRILAWLALSEARSCDVIIPLKGVGMEPYISEKDWIGLKRIYDFDMILPGYAYGIVTKEWAVVKYLHEGNKKENVIARSHNTMYNDIEVPKEKILELYLVKCIIPFSKITNLV